MWQGIVRFVASVGLVATAAVGVVASSPGPASACSCVPESVADSYDRADAVFLAELAGRSENDGLFGPGDRTTLSFHVSDVYKGKVRSNQEVVTASSGASCGLELRGEGTFAVFARNQPYDDGTDPEPGIGQLVGDLCGGSQPLTNDVRTALDAEATPTNPITVADSGADSSSAMPMYIGFGVVAVLLGGLAFMLIRFR